MVVQIIRCQVQTPGLRTALLRRRPCPNQIFYRTLEKVYYEQGFFNVIREFDHHVRQDEGPITLVLRGLGAIDAYVDRSANGNGTARIMATVQRA